MYPDDPNLNYETEDAVYWFSTPFDPLSNWSAHAVVIWGQRFPTVEHAFHYRKFSDKYPEIAKQIIDAPSPWAAMQVERRYHEKRRGDWQEVKVGIMTEIVRAKVAQNDDVRQALLKTGNKRIIENSPWDEFWGIGADAKGKNQMGEILMLLRSEITESKM